MMENGWDQYKRLVISELERTNSRLNSVDKRLTRIERNIAILQTKTAAWSAGIALFISGSTGLLIKIL
jgi:hypothetical protein